MSSGQGAEFTTPQFDIHTYDYPPPKGEKEFEKDRFIRIWIPVTKRDRVLDKYQWKISGPG